MPEYTPKRQTGSQPLTHGWGPISGTFWTSPLNPQPAPLKRQNAVNPYGTHLIPSGLPPMVRSNAVGGPYSQAKRKSRKASRKNRKTRKYRK